MPKVYLHTVPRQEALMTLLKNIAWQPGKEHVSVWDALERVTAEPILAKISLPLSPVSAMDGIAVKASTTYGASDRTPLTLQVGQYTVVDTGDPLPYETDAVIKVEDLQPLEEEGTFSIMAPAAPGQYVRPVGEDVVAGEMLVPAWHKLAPPDLGALLAGGYQEIAVVKKPKVAVLPTGDELLPPGQTPKRGEFVEFNGTVISAYLRQWGAEPILYPITKDKKEDLRQAVKKALAEADMVLINAGSSAGRDDYTAAIIGEFGEVLVHGVATRPGKPVILGTASGKPILGLPGYPVSAYLALDWFAKPLLDRYYRRGDNERPTLKVKLGKRVVSDLGSEEFVRLTIGCINGEYVANPLGRGAGMTMTMVQAHGLLVIPAHSLGYEQGEEVEVELYQNANTLQHNLLATGSHDLALDFLATAIKEYDPRLNLASSHVGSMGGILAIRRNEAHIAGVHLLDVTTGEYNNPFIAKYFPEDDVVLVHLAWRTQGFMVAPGNPLGIHTIKDLVVKQASYINRQKGAGTRLLFDWLLTQENLTASDIYGYEREEYTHLNVAAAIAAGTADVGLGIDSAAKAYHLDFIPVGRERYDLLMRRSFYQSEAGQILLKTILDENYAQLVESMGGYDMSERGKILYPEAELGK